MSKQCRKFIHRCQMTYYSTLFDWFLEVDGARDPSIDDVLNRPWRVLMTFDDGYSMPLVSCYDNTLINLNWLSESTGL